jgi:hypothetical protein
MGLLDVASLSQHRIVFFSYSSHRFFSCSLAFDDELTERYSGSSQHWVVNRNIPEVDHEAHRLSKSWVEGGCVQEFLGSEHVAVARLPGQTSG